MGENKSYPYLNDPFSLNMDIYLQILPKGIEKTLGKKDLPPSPKFSGYMDQALTCLISENSLVLYGKLGNGSFGVVKKGDWTTPSGNKVTHEILLKLKVLIKCIAVAISGLNIWSLNK